MYTYKSATSQFDSTRINNSMWAPTEGTMISANDTRGAVSDPKMLPLLRLSAFLLGPPWLRRHRRDHGIVGLALSRDAVIVLGGEELQQPLFGHLIGVLVGKRLEPALGAPAADGAGGVAGNAGDLVGVQHVGLAGQQVLVPAAHTPAGGVGEEERAVQAEGWGLVVRVVLVPAAGRGVVRRLRQAAAQVGGHVRFGDLVAAGLLAGVLAGHQPALQQIQRGAGADATGFAEVGAAHGVGIGRQQVLDLPLQSVLKEIVFLHFRFSFVWNLDPENHYVFHRNYTNC